MARVIPTEVAAPTEATVPNLAVVNELIPTEVIKPSGTARPRLKSLLFPTDLFRWRSPYQMDQLPPGLPYPGTERNIPTKMIVPHLIHQYSSPGSRAVLSDDF